MMRLRSLLLLLLVVLASPAYLHPVSAQAPSSPRDTDADLKQRILLEFPNWTNMTDWERVTALRHWAAVRIDLSSESLLLTKNKSFSFYAQSVSTIFQAFENNMGGVWCGGAAWTLMLLYQLFGYESHYLGSGIESYDTHAETLVNIDAGGSRVVSVQDAYFDIGYANQDGRPLDYFRMLSILRSHGDKEIQIVPPPDLGITRGLLVTVSEEPLWHKTSPPSWLNVSDSYITLANGWLLFTVNFSAASFEKYSPSAQRFLDFLAIQGYPRSLIYIHLYPFQIDHSQSAVPSAPVLVSPEAGATRVSLTPTLSWNAVSGSCIKYSVLIFSSSPGNMADSAGVIDSSSLDTLMDGAVLADLVSSTESLVDGAVLSCSVTSYTVPSGKLANGTAYRWLVNANNTVGWGPASYRFFTTFGVPAAPVLVSPADGVTGVSWTPTLSWEAVPGSCIKYSVLIYSLSPSSAVDKAAFSCSVTSYTVPSGKLASATKYRWFVTAYNAAGWGPRSYRDFTTADSSPSPSPPSRAPSSLNAAVDNGLLETLPATGSTLGFCIALSSGIVSSNKRTD